MYPCTSKPPGVGNDPLQVNDLEAYFHANPGRLILKWRHYFEVYERHLAAYRGKPVTLIEFGVLHGGSLQMWRHYLGPQARIVGVDVNPACAQLAEEGIDIVIGDQADPNLHARLRQSYPTPDIVIDDGGHRPEQQITSFLQLYPALALGGLYLVEDTHTSLMPYWGGGVRREGTFLEFAKTLIDQLQAWYQGVPIEPDLITATAYGLHFYDSLFVVEKRAIEPPRPVATGEPTMGFDGPESELLIALGYRKPA